MTIQTRERRQAINAMRYHREEREKCIRAAWQMINEGLEQTRGYHDLQMEIQRHDRLIAAIEREYGQREQAQGGRDGQ